MAYEVNCAPCQAVVGYCVNCGGCFLRHCQCDPCQHGHPRAEIAECPFCRPTLRGPDLDRAEAERSDEIQREAEERLGEDS